MSRPLLASLILALAACNTAQVMEPPVEDGGGGQCITDVSVPQCDAGGVTLGCTGDPASTYAAVNGLPTSEVVPYLCKVQRSAVNTTTGECDIVSECQCTAPDAGADGGAGTWTCLTAH